MSLWQRYKRSLKHVEVEEVLDLILFRPVAFVLVEVLVQFPITPNQITFLSVIAGILAGVLFSLGTANALVVGSLVYGLGNVLDCCDGMVARLKNNGSLVGRLVDGYADYVVSIAIFAGLGIGLSKGAFPLPANPWVLIFAAAASTAWHSFLFDRFRNEFLAKALGKYVSAEEEVAAYDAELARLQTARANPAWILLIKTYIRYTRLQTIAIEPAVQLDSEEYFERNRLAIKLWSFVGSTTHIFVLIVASLAGSPLIFFYYSIVFANDWVLLVRMYQRQIERRMFEENRQRLGTLSGLPASTAPH